MSDPVVLSALIAAAATVLVPLIGIYVNRQSQAAKKREEVSKAAIDRDTEAWQRLENQLDRMDKKLGQQDEKMTQQDQKIERLEAGLAEAQAEAQAARRREAEAKDQVRDLDQILDAFIQDRMDLDRWAAEGGKPPVPKAHWRVIQIIEKRGGKKEGKVTDVSTSGA